MLFSFEASRGIDGAVGGVALGEREGVRALKGGEKEVEVEEEEDKDKKRGHVSLRLWN